MSNLTILIPTSPIPSHPSTEILDETISNIRKYSDQKIIILADGVHHSLAHRTEDYEHYKDNVATNIEFGKYGDCVMKEFLHHRHQSGMLNEIINEITSELIFFVEHDTHIAGDIPFEDICRLIRIEPEINYVRFNIFDRILPEHQYLMLTSTNFHCKSVIPLTKTIQYSARPNIAKTNWWKDILWTYFNGKRSMIEDEFYGVVVNKYKALGFDTFGLYIYTPEGNQLRSFTSDGRKDDPKIISDNIIVHSAK